MIIIKLLTIISLSGLINSPGDNISNVHIEQTPDVSYLVWNQINPSKLNITQEGQTVSLDMQLFAVSGQNKIEILYKTTIFDSYDRGLHGPFYPPQKIFIPVAIANGV